MNKLLAIILFFVSLACFAETEVLLEENREFYRQKMLSMLAAEKIPYTIENGNQIYYPVTFKQKVETLQYSIWGATDDGKKGVRVSAELAPSLEAELVKKGVPFSVSSSEGKSVFTWQVKVDQSAMKVVNEVIDRPRQY